MLQNNDELNSIDTKSSIKRSIPYKKYFDEMEISEEEKEKRIKLAEKLELVFMYLFYLIANSEYENREMLCVMIADMYSDIAHDYMNVDGTLEYLNTYTAYITAQIIDTTLKYAEQEEYYLSQDRAMFIAENEANSIGNYDDMYQAIKSGATQKTWKTMNDKKVRHTHVKLDGKTIGIYKTFDVGGSEMLYPRDTSYDAEDKEIVNCRCVCEYS